MMTTTQQAATVRRQLDRMQTSSLTMWVEVLRKRLSLAERFFLRDVCELWAGSYDQLELGFVTAFQQTLAGRGEFLLVRNEKEREAAETFLKHWRRSGGKMRFQGENWFLWAGQTGREETPEPEEASMRAENES